MMVFNPVRVHILGRSIKNSTVFSNKSQTLLWSLSSKTWTMYTRGEHKTVTVSAHTVHIIILYDRVLGRRGAKSKIDTIILYSKKNRVYADSLPYYI